MTARDDLGSPISSLTARGPFHRSTRVIALIGSAALALICWYFGLDVWQAATFGAVAASFGLFYNAVPELREERWPDVRPARSGARHDISWLASSLRPRYGRVGHSAVQALRALAEQRLALRHLDLNNADDRSEIERVLGHQVYAVLQPESRGRPTYRTVLKCLDALDGLGTGRGES